MTCTPCHGVRDKRSLASYLSPITQGVACDTYPHYLIYMAREADKGRRAAMKSRFELPLWSIPCCYMGALNSQPASQVAIMPVLVLTDSLRMEVSQMMDPQKREGREDTGCMGSYSSCGLLSGSIIDSSSAVLNNGSSQQWLDMYAPRTSVASSVLRWLTANMATLPTATTDLQIEPGNCYPSAATPSREMWLAYLPLRVCRWTRPG